MLTYAPLNFIAIGIGATLGAWLRWVLGLKLNGAGWPWGTLTANLVGGYLIGVMVALIASHPEWPAWIRLAAVTGFLGGLTTFSTFSAETVDMLCRGVYATAAAYAGASLAGSLAMTGLGLATVRLLLR
uniref:Fluoride ion transporter CrcB n=1 Tax=Bordetella pertussis (strain Tohama I / ATCC BAA-589 / NCTC 13251) TaxID=257313 RepID=UPI0006AB76D9|nr:Chain A, Putative Fluoride Ion Transporter Crcb [Bordetella pertussis]5A40_B Chain B, Putative Fluoride Ion Transporter Crcb [Bordetella pertussis]5A40_C Chain C, Putative Fluoride Ion Transporter Crcb [Bordetella pertussis]5A40_D Chain D, Putative Fluoride Ion Transporter Crcb [Bordetella pertussis]5NKQ_A Chain A, Putative fluoride ion transporter CrcB [Bordetella pertussis]5NKQ_B Chain B, Putative fluoride ion transporter CrcB [Bordetella pertussis]5NKQ_C Chain C, Putative fluoride ion t